MIVWEQTGDTAKTAAAAGARLGATRVPLHAIFDAGRTARAAGIAPLSLLNRLVQGCDGE